MTYAPAPPSEGWAAALDEARLRVAWAIAFD